MALIVSRNLVLLLIVLSTFSAAPAADDDSPTPAPAETPKPDADSGESKVTPPVAATNASSSGSAAGNSSVQCYSCSGKIDDDTCGKDVVENKTGTCQDGMACVSQFCSLEVLDTAALEKLTTENAWFDYVMKASTVQRGCVAEMPSNLIQGFDLNVTSPANGFNNTDTNCKSFIKRYCGKDLCNGRISANGAETTIRSLNVAILYAMPLIAAVGIRLTDNVW